MSKIDVLGVQIDALTKEELLHKLKNILTYKQIFITTPYSEMIVAAQNDEEFRAVLNFADFSLPDGIGVLWAAHYLCSKSSNLVSSLLSILLNPKSIRSPIPEKISGSDFVWDLAALAAQKDFSIFLLGGYGDTPKLVTEKLKSKFPNITVAGAYSGDPEEPGIVERINNSGADFLFVALGPIRQEKWIYENLPKLRVKLAIGLGGTFDYLAQKRPLAPELWAQRGLEWLWRLITQPWRAGRILKGIFGLIYYTIKAGPRGNQFRGGGI